jgi:3-deoxy-D-manno-octulosonic-acid transferase
MLAEVDLFLMQGQADADRIITLGAPRGRVRVMGSLKWDASLGIRPSPAAIQEAAVALGLNGDEAVIVAGSTHRGEEAAVLAAFRAIQADQPARLIVAPRHLERVAEAEQLARQAGFSVVRLSQAGGGGRWEVGIVDTFGELPRYYGVATIVFVGGSLIPHGGQNPLEAAGLGKPILFGPSMENFAEITEQLLAHRAARQLASWKELAAELRDLLANPTEALACGRRAQELVERSQGVAQRTLDAIRPFLAV